MSDTDPLKLSCRFCRPLVEGCPSVFEVTLSSSVAEPVRDITLEFRCAGLRGGVAERTLTKPLSAFEVLTLDLDIEPERKGTPPMTVHIHASTSRGRFTAHGSVRPAGQAGISILERPADMQSLTVQIQEKAFFGAMFTEGGIDIGKVKTLNDFLQLHLPMDMYPVALSWDGFPVARSLKPDRIFAARFKLIEPLGQGGMGVVWLAKDVRIQEQVALKFLPETVCYDPDAIDDLKRELRLSRQLAHENIVRIHDLIEAEGTVAISMEYIRGKTLSALRREQPSRVFSTTQLLPWLQQLCTALDYAHGKGIIHHDLKPLNLMINEAGVLKVCDFGLAGSMAESRSRHSRPGHTSGTTPYMSPQHLLLGSRTISDDVYALGATLYELLTSKAPFYAGSIETQIERTEPSSMEERRVMLSITGADPVLPEWEAAVQDCLKKKSEDRPRSAGDILSQLTAPPKMSSAEEQKKALDAEAREHTIQEEQAEAKEKQSLALEAGRLTDEALKTRARNMLERQRLNAEAKRQKDEDAARQRIATKKKQEEAKQQRQENSRRQQEKGASKHWPKIAAAFAILSLGALASRSKTNHVVDVPRIVENDASPDSSKSSALNASALAIKYSEKALQELDGIDAEFPPTDRSNLGDVMRAEAKAATTKIQALCEIAAIKNQNDDGEGCRQIFETAKKLAEGISLHQSYWILSGDESFLLPRLSLNTIARVSLDKPIALFCIAKSEHFINFKDDESRRLIMRPSDEWMNDELKGDAWLRAIFLARLAEVQVVLGEIESGEANFDKAMETAGKQKNTRNRLKSLLEVQCIKAVAYHHVGDHVKSLQVLADAIAQTKETQEYWSVVENFAYIARIQILLGERELGRQSFQLALSTAMKMEDTYEKGSSLKEIAQLQAISGETEAAKETLQQITDRYQGARYEYKNEGLAALEKANLLEQRLLYFDNLEKSSSETTHNEIANVVAKMSSSHDRMMGFISLAKGLLKK